MEHEIIEYCNPCFPDIPYYRCTIKGETYHHTDLSKIVDWRQDRIINANKYAKMKQSNDEAMALFMEDVKFKD
jgi:hypothetical protein